MRVLQNKLSNGSIVNEFLCMLFLKYLVCEYCYNWCLNEDWRQWTPNRTLEELCENIPLSTFHKHASGAAKIKIKWILTPQTLSSIVESKNVYAFLAISLAHLRSRYFRVKKKMHVCVGGEYHADTSSSLSHMLDICEVSMTFSMMLSSPRHLPSSSAFSWRK